MIPFQFLLREYKLVELSRLIWTKLKLKLIYLISSVTKGPPSNICCVCIVGVLTDAVVPRLDAPLLLLLLPFCLLLTFRSQKHE